MTEPAGIEPPAVVGGTAPSMAAALPAPAAQVPPLVGARQLIGSAFELLLRSGDRMRRASFYIGLVVLGTAGPLALALWGNLVAGSPFDYLATDVPSVAEFWLAVLLGLMVAGIIIGAIESTAIAIGLLGGELVGRPLTIRQAVQRSRMVFWSIVVANLAVSVPTALMQQWIGDTTEVGVIAGLAVATLIQTPFVYAPAGIVLGGVGPIEALRRSIRIARARKIAALILAILPSIYGLLILVAFTAGLDLAVRAIDALGLGADSGPAGVAVISVGIVMVAFALGTLLFTVTAIVYAPQVVMFVGLTRATMGLDRVRPGADHDPAVGGRGRPRFRWLTVPMLIGFTVGAVGLAGYLATVTDPLRS